MTPVQKEELDNAARLQQMKINTRLTALQSALELMKTAGYIPHTAGLSGASAGAGQVDHVTLLAMAQDIEAYILGGLEDEAKQAMERAKKPPPPNILQVRS